MDTKGETRPKLLIICCEGERTEPQYFDALIKNYRIRSSVSIEVINDQGQHKVLIDNAVKVRDQQAKAKDIKAKDIEVWVVCDKDLMHYHLDELVAYAKKRNVQLAFTDPCFEVFFLQHFCKSTTSATGKTLEARISKEMAKKGLDTPYKKEDISFFKKLIYEDPQLVLNAIKNCAAISDPSQAPYTTTHILVERMLSFTPRTK